MSTKSYSCGPLFPSGCVLFTGDLPAFIDPDDFPCDGTIDDLLGFINPKLDSILSSIDLTDLEKGCLDFNPATIDIKGLHQIEIDKICELDERTTTVEDALSNFDVGAHTLQIDLGCLASDAAPCAVAADTYTLLSILLTLKNAICDLQTQVEDCCSGGATTSGTSGTSGINGTSGSTGTSGSSGSSGTGGTSGSTGTSGSSGTGGTSGGTGGLDCNYYTVNYTGEGSGTTVYWENCDNDSTPMSAFFTNTISFCSAILPTADDSIEIINNGSCGSASYVATTVILSNSLTNICSQSTATVYSAAGIDVGQTLYHDSSFITTVTGFLYVVDLVTGFIYNLNGGGQVTSQVIGQNC